MTELIPPPPPDFRAERLPRIASRHGFINIDLFNELQAGGEAEGLAEADFRQVARAGASATALLAFIRHGAKDAAPGDHRAYRGQLRRVRARYAAGQWRDESQRRFFELLFPGVVPRRPDEPDGSSPSRQPSS
jgi:hypothetical protein